MLFKVKITKAGSVASCDFIDTTQEDGASLFYVEADSQATACDEAKRRWKAKQAVRAALVARADTAAKCRHCLKNPRKKGASCCESCLKNKREAQAAKRARMVAAGYGAKDRVPPEMRQIFHGGGRKPGGPGGDRLRFRLEALRDVAEALRAYGLAGIREWVRIETARCEKAQRDALRVAKGEAT